jgi:hypothetical protein
VNEVALIPWWLTLFLTLWAALGPIVGIVLGNYLSRNNQRKQWRTDNRVNEWRELISVLFRSVTTISECDALRRQNDIKVLNKQGEAEMTALLTIGNRVFIDKDITEERLFQHWNQAVERFREQHNPDNFGAEFKTILESLKKKASHDIEGI